MSGKGGGGRGFSGEEGPAEGGQKEARRDLEKHGGKWEGREKQREI